MLGNPTDQTPIDVNNVANVDVYFGKLSTLTSDRGARIFKNGGRRTFENISAGWRISFITASGTSTLRRVDYI